MIPRNLKCFLALTLSLCFFSNLYSVTDSLFFATQLHIDGAQRKNYRYLGDILFSMPGYWVRDMSATGQWASGRVGGQNHTLILLDGRPLNEPWSGNTELNLIPVELIDRIEIYQTINPFGFTHRGGLVNLVSKEIPSNRPYTKFVHRIGSDKFSDLDITFGQKFTQKFEISSGVLIKKYGELLPYEKYQSQQVRSKIKYAFSPNLEFRYTILSNKSDIDLPFYFNMPGDSLILTSPHRDRMRLDHTLETNWNLWGTSNTARFEYTSISHEIRQTNVIPAQSFPVKSTAFFLKQVLRLGKIPTSWGIRTTQNTVQDTTGFKYKNTIHHGFLQAEFLLSKNFKDHFQIHGHVSTHGKPDILLCNQLSWSPQPTLQIWTGYAQSVRDPSLGERFGYPFIPSVPEAENQLLVIQHWNNILPNPDLKPELGKTFDMGLRWQWKKVQAHFRSFYSTAQDLIDARIIADGIQFGNLNKATFEGVESLFHLGPWHGIQGSVTLNLLRARDGDGNDLLERSNLWGNGSLSWRHNFFEDDLKVNLCLASRFWSGFWKLNSLDWEQSYLQYQDPGFTLDFKIFCTVIQNANIYFAMDNILGREFAFVSHFFMPQRITRFGISWALLD